MNEKLEKAKEIIAKELNYKDWETCINDQPNYKIEGIMDKVAERYHELMDEWISVDTPPEIDSRVMLLVNSLGQKYVCIGVYKGYNLYKKDKGTLSKPMEVIEKWKPLPKQ